MTSDLIDVDRPRLQPSRTHHGYRHLLLLAEQLDQEFRAAAPSVTVDLGCGAKPYQPIVPGHYIGLDLTTAHGAPDALAWAEATPLRDGCADVVLSTQQLEHVDDPDLVIAEAARLLRPGGKLLLSTHGVWPYHPDPFDRWRWTDDGLRTVVERNGLVVERVHHQGELFTAALLLLSYPIGAVRRRGPRLIRALAGVALVFVNSLCAPLDGILERTRRRHYASPSYLVVARRPGSALGS